MKSQSTRTTDVLRQNRTLAAAGRLSGAAISITTTNSPAAAASAVNPPPGSLVTPGATAGFALGVLAFYIVVRFSMAHEFITDHFGFNSRYHYICVPILLAAAALSGRVPAVIGSGLGIAVTGFTAWMVACIPTSIWRGGSFAVLRDYLPNEFMIFLVLGCLLTAAARQTRAFYAFALALPIFLVIVSSGATQTASGRLALEYGTFSNPNSIATHPLFLSPFLAFYMLERKSVFRIIFGLLVGAATLATFFKTGSRSGLLALIAMLAVIMVRLSLPKKLAALLLLMVAVPLALIFVPESAMLRYKTIFLGSDVDVSDQQAQMLGNAVASTEERKMVFWDSVKVSFDHPIFGVGPGQYSVDSAERAKDAGMRANWLVTHNAYTQVSSEMGLVGFVFYLGMLIGTGIYLARIRKSTRNIPALQTIRLMATCLQMSWISYCVFSVFDAIAYKQYAPLLAGMALGLDAAMKQELEAQKTPAPARA